MDNSKWECYRSRAGSTDSWCDYYRRSAGRLELIVSAVPRSKGWNWDIEDDDGITIMAGFEPTLEAAQAVAVAKLKAWAQDILADLE